MSRKKLGVERSTKSKEENMKEKENNKEQK